ncbi:MAG TPA: hypothetical protein VIL65_15185 [Beijerinckiaceae bacterium]|jgi:hypothetical protein
MAKAAKKLNKLPKTIAGVKIPKSLRKLGPLGQLMDHPLGREILADALIAAAGAAAAALVKHRPSGAQLAQAGEQVAEAGEKAVAGGAQAASLGRDLVQTAAGAVAEVVVDAAKSVLPGAAKADEAPSKRRKGKGETPRHH